MVSCGRVCVGGSLESGCRLCVCASDWNAAPVAVKMFSHSIYLIKTFCKCLYIECDLQR
jgi:hypothetical protein